MLQTKRRIAVLVISLAVVALAGGIVAASIPAADGTITGCYQKNNGQLRVVESAAQCNPSELALTWQQQGPAGPQGPQGEPGVSSSGSPYVWVCTPASYPNFGSHPRADVYVFNGGSSDAHVSVRFYDKDGQDLATHNIPGTSSPTEQYPDVSNQTVTPNSTLDVTFSNPVTSPEPFTDVAFSVKVTSTDQPIVVGSNFSLGTPNTTPCSLLPK